MFIVSIFIGIVMVALALYLIRREINQATYKRSQIIEQSQYFDQKDLFETLETLQISINEMNESFYDIANDLEGKYSIHEKEISLLNERFDAVDRHLKAIHGKPKPQIKSEQQGQSQTSEHLINRQVSGSQEAYQHLNQMDKQLKDRQIASEKDQAPEVMSDKEEDLRSQVIMLRSQGLSLVEIAKKLGIGIGELQLMLNIKK